MRFNAEISAVVSTVTAGASYTFNNVSVPFLGVPLTAFGMAAAGAVMSFAFGDQEKSRSKLFAICLVSTLFGCACVTVVPWVVGMELTLIVQPPLAFMFALFARWIIPALKGALPAMANAIAGMFNRGGGGYQQYDMPPPPQNNDNERNPPNNGGY